jgi:tetratricopeptide (TPR) repeat protein
LGVRGELSFAAKGQQTTIAIESPRFTIGRGDDNTLSLAEPMVSRYHAELIRIGDDFLLRDHGSTNGSYVNDARVAEQILADGDVMRFGKGGPEVTFHLVDQTDGLTTLDRARPGTTENLIDSLAARLDAISGSPEEEANARCLLAASYLKKGNVESAAKVTAPYADPAYVDTLPQHVRAMASLWAGTVAVEAKRYDEAHNALRRAIEYFTRSGDQSGVAEAHASLGRALIGAGDLFGARDSLQRALLFARKAGNELVAAKAHLSLGRIDWKEGDLDGAGYNWARAARLSERVNDPVVAAQVRLQQAFMLASEGKLAEAVPAYQSAIKEIEAIGNVRLLLKAYSSLSRVLTRQGSWLATERLLGPRLKLAREHGILKAEAVALTDEAELRLLQGNVEQASNVIGTAAGLFGTTIYARTQRILGRVLAASRLTTEAVKALEKGLIAARTRGSIEEQVLIGFEMALVLVELGDLAAAKARLDEAEATTSLDPALALMGRALYTRGTILAASGQTAEANRCFTQSLSIFQTMGDPYRLGLSHAAVGALRFQMNRNESARAHLEEARDLFTRLGAAAELARVKDRLSSTQLLTVKPALTSQLSTLTTGRGTVTTIGHKTQIGEPKPQTADPSRVLLAASNEALAVVLHRGLEVENYIVHRVEHGRAALDRSVNADPAYDILLLDALLEFQSGFDVCRELRRRELDVPVILLGSRQSVEDKIDALHVGADDYLCQRDIVIEELLAKMEALLR